MSFVLRSTLAGSLGLALALVAAPQPAQACGGTFCDSGPQSMPVDQSGENILFILDGDQVEVHIQIQYDGDPEKFAWVIPLTAVPEFSVGSESLFQNLLNGTVPTYGFTTVRDQCPVQNGNGLPGGQGLNDGAGLTGGAGTDGGEEGGGGPDIVLRETVGAYEIVVLQGGTAVEVVEWLDANGYQQDPEAEPILEEYLQEGHLFGAIKLTGGAGVDEIHPIVLRYSSTEPCVPLRLTRIAAVEDMEIRTFFLGNERMVPTNYRHVLVNPVKIDWPQLAFNYKEIITLAVDAEHADGRAFVTEYAGPSDVVSSDGVYSANWDPSYFTDLPATQLPTMLQNQGLLYCDEWSGCQFLHPLIGGVLGEYLVPPNGLTLEAFLEDPTSSPGATWDGAGFADAFAERIAGPGLHAAQLLQQWPYVTRMYTTISPHEMTADPIFHALGDLDDVPNIRQATQRILCSNDRVFILPDGREVFLPQGASWPEFPNEMPYEEEVSEMPMAGSPMILANRTAEIDQLLAAYNSSVGWDTQGCPGCTVEDEDHRSRWVLALGVLMLGAGLARRRRRQRSS